MTQLLTKSVNDVLLKPGKITQAQTSQHDILLEDCKKQSYLNTPEKYLKVDNNLSELDTKEEQLAARLNLGIDGLAQWGNVQGYLEDQKDLMDYLRDKKVNIELPNQTEAAKQLMYVIKNSDLKLNSSFNNALSNVLNGKEVQSIDDILNIILFVLFPITYTDWQLDVSCNAQTSYSIEKGTSKKLNLDSKLGDIVINLIKGNKKDNITSLKLNDEEILQENEIQYTIPVYVKDLTSNLQIAQSLSKTYKIVLQTDLPNTLEKNVFAKITINTYQNYFYEMYDVFPTENIYSPSENTGITTSNTYQFNIGNSQEKYLSVISPKNITKVETAASTTGKDGSFTQFYTTDNFIKETVYYTPEGGTQQTYYRITLPDLQGMYVKIKVT